MTAHHTILLPGCAPLRPEAYFVLSSRAGASEPTEPDDAGGIDALLEQALNLPTAARQAFLNRIGDEHPELRQTLDTLLEGVDEEVPPGFLKPLPHSRAIIDRVRKQWGDPPAPSKE